MTGKQARRGAVVWAELAGARRPGIVTAEQGQDRWVSFTDDLSPQQARLRPGQLEQRRIGR